MLAPKILMLNIILQVLFFATCPILGIIMLFCIIWRILIWSFLKLKHGEKFGGLLSLEDSFFAIKLVTKTHTHFCLIVRTNHNFNDFYARIKTTLRDKSSHDYFKKLSSLKMKCCGIDYLLKDEFKVDQMINIWDLKRDSGSFVGKKQLEELISRYALEDLQDNRRFLEMRVVKQKVKISTDHYNNYDHDQVDNNYAILIKLHHSLTDGIHFVKFLAYLSDNDNVAVFNKFRKKMSLFKLLPRTPFYGIDFITKLVRINTDKTNPFINITLTHRDYYTFSVENEAKFVPLIKQLRQKVPNTPFADFVVAAAAASLSDFYQKRNIQETTGNNFYVFLPVALQTSKENVLTNKFTWSRKILPLLPISKQTVYEKLERISIQDSNSGKPEFLMLCQQLLSLTPPFFSSYFSNKISLGSAAVSIVPAFDKNINLFGGELTHFIGFAPPMPAIGITFTLLTYDVRFQLAFSIDKAFVKNGEEAGEIMNGVYKYLLKLEEEVNSQKVTV